MFQRLTIFLISLIYSGFVGIAQDLNQLQVSDNLWSDKSYGIALDTVSQYVYVCGAYDAGSGSLTGLSSFFTNSLTSVSVPAVEIPTLNQGGKDAYLIKLDYSGNPIWMATMSGQGDDYFMDVAVTTTGQVVLTGSMSDGAIIQYGNGFQDFNYQSSDTQDAVVLSFSTEGSLEWLSKVQTSDNNIGLSIQQGGDGIVVSGLFGNTGGDDDSDGTIFSHPIAEDGELGSYVALLNYSGECLWFKAYTSPDFDYSLTNPQKLGADVAANSSYIFHVNFLSGSHYTCYDNNTPAGIIIDFPTDDEEKLGVFSYNFDGSHNYADISYIPDEAPFTSGPFISAECQFLYITGTIGTNLNSPVANVEELASLTQGSVPTIFYIKKFAASGVNQIVQAYTSAGSPDRTYVTDIASDKNRRVFLSGRFENSLKFSATPSENVNDMNANGGWIRSMDDNGSFIWNYTLNGTEDDEITSMALDGLDYLFFSGTTASSLSGLISSPVTPGNENSFYGKIINDPDDGIIDFNIICPENITVNSNSECGTTGFTPQIPFIDNPCLLVSLTSEAPAPLAFGDNTITWTAIDSRGVVKTCSQIVHVQNVSVPASFICDEAITLTASAGECGITSKILAPPHIGTCDDVSITNNFNDSNEVDQFFAVGNTSILWHLTDNESGETATCETIVTVLDEEDPIALCHATISLEIEPGELATIQIDQVNNGSFDNCSDWTISPSEFSVNETLAGESFLVMTITDASGNFASCGTLLSLSVNNPNTVVVDAGNAIEICSGLTVPLNGSVSGASAFHWSGGIGSFSDPSILNPTYSPAASEYSNGSVTLTLTATDNEGVSFSDEVIITFTPFNTIEVTALDEILCSNDPQVTLNVVTSNNLDFNLTNGLGDLIILSNSSASYIPTASEIAQGNVNLVFQLEGNITCGIPTDEVMISFVEQPEAIINLSPEICGLTFDLVAVPTNGNGQWTIPDNVILNGNAGSPTLNVTVPAQGNYTFTWFVQQGECEDETSININVFEPVVSVFAGEDVSSVYTTAISLGATPADFGEGTWSSDNLDITFTNANDPTTIATNLQAGEYIFTWTVRNGNCPSLSDAVKITIKELIIPTGFSPNSDNINDFFEIDGLESISPLSIQVLNRWGEEVFSADDYQNNWNGLSASGNELPSDTYYCVIKSNKIDETITGYIVINR